MATSSVPNTFVNGTPADAGEVNANFTSLVSFANNSVVHVDGTKAMTSALDAGSNKVINLATGTNGNDAVNKTQMDAAIAAIDVSTSGGVSVQSSTTSSVSLTTSDQAIFSVTFTAETGHSYKLTYHEPGVGLPATVGGFVTLGVRLTNASGTVIDSCIYQTPTAYNLFVTGQTVSVVSPAAGSVTYVAVAKASSTTGGPSLTRGSTSKAYFIVEDLGVL
jgi:hypothetical protein